MPVTEYGIVIEVKLEHSLNAYAPMLVTEFGIITDINLEHPLNALALMIVTEFEIITDVKSALLGTVTEGIATVLAM